MNAKHSPLLLCVLLALAACNQSNTPAAETVITRNNTAEPKSLDPHQAEGIPEGNLVRDLFEGLVETDANGDIQAAAAQSWESSDNKVWRFHLRRDARWSDGKALSAHDFVYSWQRLVDPQNASPYASYLQAGRIRGIDDILAGKAAPDTLGIRAIDDYTLEITLDTPVPYFPRLLFHASTKPVPKHAIEQFGNQWTRPQNMVNNGAYLLDKWVVNERIELRKNPNYHSAAQVQTVRIVHLAIGSQTDDVLNYRAGNVDITDALPPEQYAEIKAQYPDELKTSPMLCTYYLEINNKAEPFTDQRVRKALSLALDRDLIAEKVLGRGESPAYNLTRVGTAGFVPNQPEWLKLTREQRIAEAKRLLAEAGYNAAKPLRFTYLYNNSEQHKKIALAATSTWKEALEHIDVQLENQEWKTYLDNRRQGRYQLARASWCGDYNEPSTFLNTLLTGNSSNRAFYSNPEYDRIMQATLNAKLSDSERSSLYTQAEAQIDRDAAVIPVYGFVNSRLVRSSIGGYSTNDVLNEQPSKRLFVKK